MKILTLDRFTYQLQLEESGITGSLHYQNADLSKATIFCGSSFHLQQSGAGKWASFKAGDTVPVGSCVIGLNGTFQIILELETYTFVKPVNWKPRFFLLNQQEEEWAALIPVINWDRQCHEFSLQINEEMIAEKRAFLILQMLHCAVCAMAMLNGTMTAAVGNMKD
jgi:hypothetical protein